MDTAISGVSFPTQDSSASVGTHLEEDNYALSIGGDGEIFAGGEVSGDFGLARYSPSGATDSVTMTDLGCFTSDSAYAMAIEGDGKVLLAGYSNSGTADFAVARYLADGDIDTSFGGNGTGIITSDIGGGSVDHATS